jgi:hypothetical protein
VAIKLESRSRNPPLFRCQRWRRCALEKNLQRTIRIFEGGQNMGSAWTSFVGPLVATTLGGAIAAYIGFHFSRKTSIIHSTYEEIRSILSDDFTSRRKKIYALIDDKSVPLAAIFNATQRKRNNIDLYDARTDILYILNKYDTIMHGVKDNIYDANTIRRTVWGIMHSDHCRFDDFIALYAEKNMGGKRPIFPQLRSYRELWERSPIDTA